MGLGVLLVGLAAHEATAWSASSRAAYAEASHKLQDATSAIVLGVPAAVLDGVLYANGASRAGAAEALGAVPADARPAFDRAAKQGTSPFAFPDYRELRFPGAEAARRAGEELLDRGRREGELASRSTVSVVIVAVALVLAAAAIQRIAARARLGLLGASGLLLLVSLVQLATVVFG